MTHDFYVISDPKGMQWRHPEAFHDAFARLHRCFETDVRAYEEGKPFDCYGSRYANVADGRMGIAFIDAAVKSSQAGGAWVDI